MSTPFWRPIAVLLLLLPGLRAVAQEVPPPAAPPKPMVLQQGLTQITPTPPGVTLTVGPQWETLPKGNPPPKPSATVADVAATFGKAYKKFGRVAAVAPPLMVLFGSPSGDPNPFLGMTNYDVVPLLSASLTEAQWASLTSEQGLSLSAMTPTQQQLFAQILPDGQLKVEPWHDYMTPGPDEAQRDLSSDLPGARLRMKQIPQFSLPIKGEENSFYMGQSAPPPASGPPAYKMVTSKNNWGNSSDTVYGQRVREEVPNAPKRGQLDMRSPLFQAPISTVGMKTVGDLMGRVSQATHLEIYADRRLEQKTLMMLGTGTSAPAVDLMQAAAFCVTGLYRQVGPAFVLTDDIEGIATRMARWVEFEKYADALRQKPLQEARAALDKRYGKQKLSAFGDPTALTDDQQKTSYGQQVPVSQLTPAQQKAVREIADNWNKGIIAGQSGNKQIDASGKVTIEPTLSLELIVPSLQTPLDTGVQLGRGSLFQPPPLTKEEQRAQGEKQVREMMATQVDMILKALREHPEFWHFMADQYPGLAAEFLAAHPEAAALIKPGKPNAPPSFSDTLNKVPYRAALVSPRTVTEAASDVASAKALGLTQLWVSTFRDGEAHTDVLQAALKTAKGTGIKVYAALDLLSWGKKPPVTLQDLTVLGETSVQAEARHQARIALMGPNNYDDEQEIETPSGIAVSPASSEVRQTLKTLVRTLKAMPGLAGIVLRETAPPGYDLRDNAQGSSQYLGCQAELRLAFLRTHHADPVDVFSQSRGFSKANTDLTNFQYDGALSQTVSGEWDAYRREADLSLLRALFTTAQPLRVIVKQRGVGQSYMRDMDGNRISQPGWYGAWDNPKASPPTLYTYRDNREKQPLAGQDPQAQAQAQSRLVLMEIPSDRLTHVPEMLSMGWQNKPPPGFVLDMGDQRLSKAAVLLKPTAKSVSTK